MPNSYEHSFQHNLDDVIDASDAVLAIGTEKVDTTTLKDKSLNNNDATVHGAMPSNGYFMGRRFDESHPDYISLTTPITQSVGTYEFILFPTLKSGDSNIIEGDVNYLSRIYYTSVFRIETNTNGQDFLWTYNIPLNKIHHIIVSRNGDVATLYADGVKIDEVTVVNADAMKTSVLGSSTAVTGYTGNLLNTSIFTTPLTEIVSLSRFNTLARLPLYSHNFKRYPNSDTSLTSVFPYTSGIITSGSFNKTDGLKCTSAGQIVFSNSFEFDGSEYITLVIDGVEYSGTTTVTQGTITATIAQGSNDITIDMGTGDVLPDIRVQFREEV